MVFLTMTRLRLAIWAVAALLTACLLYAVGLALVVLALGAVGSCAHPNPAEVVRRGLPARWTERDRPVSVLQSSALSHECMEAADSAVAFWSSHGVSYLRVHVVGPEHPAYWGMLRRGQIAFVADPVSSPRHDAEAWAFAIGGQMAWAEIRLGDKCTAWHAAHELGHALELVDVDDRANVMHWQAGAYGFSTTPGQVEQVR